MQGKWIRLQAETPPRPQVRVRLATPAVAWDLMAPGTCALLDEPDEERAWKAVTSFPGAMGAALLDQSVVAGVGNVLRAESLFRAGVHPRCAAAGVDRHTFHRLWTSLVDLMRQSVGDARIISVALPAAERATVAEADGRMVYKQAACRACATPVDTWTTDGRTAYACPKCQPR